MWLDNGVCVIIFNRLSRACVAGVLLGLSLSGCARQASEAQVGEATAEIRRTSFGIPHIRASNELGLGYGIGYAYAQDNLCLLANEVVTVNGERAKYFGAQQSTLEERNNLTSDVFLPGSIRRKPSRRSGARNPRKCSSALKAMWPDTTAP